MAESSAEPSATPEKPIQIATSSAPSTHNASSAPLPHPVGPRALPNGLSYLIRRRHTAHPACPGPMPNPAPLNPAKERTGFHPIEMVKLAFRNSCQFGMYVNVFMPVVPVAIVVRAVKPDAHLAVFILNYIAMMPAANLLAYASHQLSRDLPHTLGMITQVTLASAVEIILTLLLLFRGEYQVIQAALLGSVLANLLLVTGTCFLVGGLKYHDREQRLDETVAQTGGGLLLMSAVGLLIPTAFAQSVNLAAHTSAETAKIEGDILGVSRSTAILLLISYAVFMCFQLKTHQHHFDRAIYISDILGQDYEEDARRPRLTLMEAVVLSLLALGLVTAHAFFLVEQIHWLVVNRGVSDAFIGLIVVPLVEKVAEHISAVNDAWDDSMDIALSHVLGSTIQTSLLVTPLVVIVAWIASRPLSLHFEIFHVVCYFLAVLVVGNSIQDRKTNYLEGGLCVVFYAIIASTAWFYPNPPGMMDGHH